MYVVGFTADLLLKLSVVLQSVQVQVWLKVHRLRPCSHVWLFQLLLF